MDWEVLSSQTVYEGRFRVLKDLLRRPDGGTQEYTWLPSGNAAAVLAFDDQDRVVLTLQYRHPLGRTILDLPAGGIQDGESDDAAARRELREETGYEAGSLTRLGAFYSSPGRQSTIVSVFVAHDLTHGEPEPDAEEIIEVVHMPWLQVLDHALNGEPVDSALAYAVLLWQARKG